MDDTPIDDTIDLSLCEREPIHKLGRVQHVGFLIAVDGDWQITHVSENAADFLPQVRDAASLLGANMRDFASSEVLHTLRNRAAYLSSGQVNELIMDVAIGSATFDITLHALPSGFVLDCEPSKAAPGGADMGMVRNSIAKISAAGTLHQALKDAARYARALSAYDRVMLYRFLPDDTGEVVAEARSAALSPYLGLRYPASDIPKQARALYVRNQVRSIADSSHRGVGILALDPEADVIDLSGSALRSVSEIHLEYLRNMGVAASMSISIVVGGRLWGLIACHHSTPRALDAPQRSAMLLFGQVLSLIVASKLVEEERLLDGAAESIASQVAASAFNDTPLVELFRMVATGLMPIIRADGAAVVADGMVQVFGQTPSADACRQIASGLSRASDDGLFHTHALATSELAPPDLGDSAGLLSMQISRSPRDHLLFFRRELVKTVQWAGNPDKLASRAPGATRLSPRTSFESWQEALQGQSEEWLPSEIRAVNMVRISLLEFALRHTDQVARERQRSSERQELLIAELNHRVRNILGLVSGLISQSRDTATSTGEFVDSLDLRVKALARAHDQITRQNWQPAPLAALLEVETQTYDRDGASRLVLSGPNVMLQPAALSTMALVAHEMVTNSAKYGALSVPDGRILVDLTIAADGVLRLDWREVGGPPVKPPTRRGFGSTIVERSIPFELNGAAQVDYCIDGVKARFEVPAQYVSISEDVVVGRSGSSADIEGMQLQVPNTVLIVEDNLVISLEAESILEKLGARRILTASRLSDALAIIDDERIDFALLDYNLGGETSLEAALQLSKKGVPFAFATGYGEGLQLTEELEKYPRISKPYNLPAIRQLLMVWSPGGKQV